MFKTAVIIVLILIISLLGLKIHQHNWERQEQETFVLKKISNIKIGMSVEDVEMILGRPDTVFKYKIPLDDGGTKSYSYNSGIPGYQAILITLDSTNKVLIVDPPYPRSR